MSLADLTPAEKFRAWMGIRLLNQTKAAELLHCSASAVSRVYNEDCKPDTKLALKIEEETRDSKLGQIRVGDWLTGNGAEPSSHESGEIPAVDPAKHEGAAQ